MPKSFHSTVNQPNGGMKSATGRQQGHALRRDDPFGGALALHVPTGSLGGALALHVPTGSPVRCSFRVGVRFGNPFKASPVSGQVLGSWGLRRRQAEAVTVP